MDIHQRRQMILSRQHLTSPADRLHVCQDLNGLQAQFLSYAHHALATRCAIPLDDGWGAGLVKTWSVRGTMHIFREEDLPIYLHRDRSHFLRAQDQFLDDPWASAKRKQYFAAHILACIREGIAERDTLRDSCRACGMNEQEEQSIFNSWGGLLRALSEEGRICQELREKRAFRLCPAFTPLERKEALLEQLRRYFTHFGPATVRDASYYFGLPQRELKPLLERLPLKREQYEHRECFCLEEDGTLPEIPACILLSGFDQLMLGYEKKESIFFAQEHLRGIFSRSGIVLPCLLLNGEAAASWKRSGRRVVLTPFRTVFAREKRTAEDEIRRWFPDTREISWV